MAQQMMNAKDFKIACKDCSLASLCLPVGLSDGEIQQLDQVVQSRSTVQKGQFLYHQSQVFKAIYAIRSGAFKSTLGSASGSEQIISFHLAGELMGFDGVSGGLYQVSVQALETSSICTIPFDNLLELSQKVPQLQKQLIKIMSCAYSPSTNININASADERLASFLLTVSARMQQRGFSPVEFNLPMSQQDIGNYLGLATETVCRTLKQFNQAGIIESKRRSVNILDLRQLQKLSCSSSR